MRNTIASYVRLCYVYYYVTKQCSTHSKNKISLTTEYSYYLGKGSTVKME